MTQPNQESPHLGHNQEVMETTGTVEAKVTETEIDNSRWYIVQCVTGREDKVKLNLDRRIESTGLQAKILQTLVPKEVVPVIKDGRRKQVEQKLLPGYLMVKMIMDEESWECVRRAEGVIQFPGSISTEPIPLSEEEVEKIWHKVNSEAPKVQLEFNVGDAVQIVDGPFSGFDGIVSSVNPDHGKVQVKIQMFGRETPVELDIMQIKLLNKKH